MKLSVIAATDKNNVIGRKETNSIPWKRIPVDMKRFKTLTKKAGVAIMGRLTFESIGKPLPDRKNIVITRKKDFQVDGVHIASSLENAILLAGKFDSEPEEVMVIGGGSAFAYAISSGLVKTIYLTRIQEEFEGDVFLPKIEGFKKIEKETECRIKGKDTPYNLVFERYERKD